MKSLTQATRTASKKVRSLTGWKAMFSLALVAAFAALAVTAPAQLALADAGGVPGHSFNNTFTKWVTSFGTPPVLLNMVGVVGGDVGAGTYAGEVLSNSSVGNIETLVALYHFNGGRHSFTARVTVTQDNSVGTAVITGVVTDGWLTGAPVAGAYTVYGSCPMSTPSNLFGTLCFQGVLNILVGS